MKEYLPSSASIFFRPARSSSRSSSFRLPPSSLFLKVSGAENLDVVRLVAGDDVGEGAHGHFVVARHAAALPGFGVEAAQHEDIRAPHVRELFGEVGERAR